LLTCIRQPAGKTLRFLSAQMPLPMSAPNCADFSGIGMPICLLDI
jgi:hypothetical protein